MITLSSGNQIRTPLLAVLMFTALTGAGCITSGAFYAGNLTSVELSEANYRIVGANVQGRAEAGYILGVSASQGGYASTLALFRVDGDGMLYQAAIADLWARFEAENGPVGDRPLALVNVQFDADASNYLGLYTKSVVSVRADIVEFDD